MYEHPDFRGDSVTFRNEVRDLREHALNDRISSLEVDGNQAWEVCRDVNFGGGCRVFQGTIDDLRRRAGTIAFHRCARSDLREATATAAACSAIRAATAINRQSRLVFYDRPNFRGDARNVMNSATNLGTVGDRVRSVQVYGGTWELCDGASAMRAASR